MTRIQLLLSVVAVLLLGALFFVLVWQPGTDEMDDLRAQIADVEAREQQVRTEIARLRVVREESAELEAQLSSANAVVPQAAAGPALLRQLQTSADEAGLVLQTVTFGRPAVSGFDPQLAEFTVNVSIRGGYFQTVDFLRRVEDPAITPRGLLWATATLAPSDYPELTATLTGRVFADAAGAIPADPAAEPEPDPDPEDVETDGEPNEDDLGDAAAIAPASREGQS